MELALTRPEGRRKGEFSFLAKVVAAILLVTAADWLFFFQRIGTTAGAYAGVILLVLLLIRPRLGKGPALAALAAASLYALALADSPGWLAAGLFWSAASLAVLLPRSRFDDGWRWAKRLLVHWLLLPMGPVEDAGGVRAARRRHGRVHVLDRLRHLWLPLIGSTIFLGLFAAANPLIEEVLSGVDLAAAVTGLSFARIAFWIVAAMLAWSLVRPRLARLAPRIAGEPLALPGFGSASITLSLIAFNLIFALENGLDLAFLWSGAQLPGGMNYAEYAHRGAYPLIATALLAGLFVLVALRPGSPLAQSATIRRLVYLWIAQNILLVASTILRTANYVEAYSLTELRIAALLWMGLVAVGLALICLRIWLRRSGAWLINANCGALALLLSGCAFVDLGSVAARWNVGHAREVGGPGVPLDLCYLNRLGPSALVALADLEARPLPPAFRDRVAWTRNLALDRLETEQADWRGWTWRNARRLDAARTRMAAHRLPRFHANVRACDGNALTARNPR